MRVCFGDCLFDSETREIVRSGTPVHLPPKAFALLQELLECRPKVLSKARIHERVWHGTFVSDASLARVVTELRAAIGDDPRASRFIRTVHGVGYAFCGEVAAAPATEVALKQEGPCHLLWGERAIPLSPGENILGRMPQAVVSIPSSKVSRRHARIMVSNRGAFLEDLASKNGTYVDGRRIDGAVELVDGDRIRIGPVVLVFATAPTGSSTVTESL
jgi:DNA-binding winged helix-turn-helix (wHTH) protein